MEKLLQECKCNLDAEPCCHTDGRICNCYPCLKKGYYDTLDTYNCKKKANYYVLNYGPSYASEIYYYLQNSQILESNFVNKKLKILSLGCGFAPDLAATSKYIADQQLPIEIEYTGVDMSTTWQPIQYKSGNAVFLQGDVTQQIDLGDADIVFIVKLFSTLYEHDATDAFLDVLEKSVHTAMNKDTVFVFNDVNHEIKGRDELYDAVSSLFKKTTRYFFQSAGWKPPTNRIIIQRRDLVFTVPSGLQFSPLPNVSDAFFYECRN